ncbi:MAG: TrmH family RNA methyltransferase [bacterium]
MTVISSSKNSDIRYLKKLYQSRKRKQENKFILEGKRIVLTALNKDVEFDIIFVTPDFLEKNPEFKDKELLKNIDIKSVKEGLLSEIADTVSPQGIIAIVKKPDYSFDKIEDTDKIVVLDRIQDPGNMGTLIRTAVAAGMESIIALKGCVDIYNLKVLRATMGAIFAIPILTRIEADKYIELYKKRDYNLIASDASRGDYYYTIEYKEPFMIVIGNEAKGVREDLINISDTTVKIPIIGEIDSLNAAIAGGIIFYRAIEENELLDRHL